MDDGIDTQTRKIVDRYIQKRLDQALENLGGKVSRKAFDTAAHYLGQIIWNKPKINEKVLMTQIEDELELIEQKNTDKEVGRVAYDVLVSNIKKLLNHELEIGPGEKKEFLIETGKEITYSILYQLFEGTDFVKNLAAVKTTDLIDLAVAPSLSNFFGVEVNQDSLWAGQKYMLVINSPDGFPGYTEGHECDAIKGFVYGAVERFMLSSGTTRGFYLSSVEELECKGKGAELCELKLELAPHEVNVKRLQVRNKSGLFIFGMDWESTDPEGIDSGYINPTFYYNFMDVVKKMEKEQGIDSQLKKNFVDVVEKVKSKICTPYLISGLRHAVINMSKYVTKEDIKSIEVHLDSGYSLCTLDKNFREFSYTLQLVSTNSDLAKYVGEAKLERMIKVLDGVLHKPEVQECLKKAKIPPIPHNSNLANDLTEIVNTNISPYSRIKIKDFKKSHRIDTFISKYFLDNPPNSIDNIILGKEHSYDEIVRRLWELYGQGDLKVEETIPNPYPSFSPRKV